MQIPTLIDWSAQRSGDSITITHACGKVAGVKSIQTDLDGTVFAILANETTVELLANIPHSPNEPSCAVSDLFFNHEAASHAYSDALKNDSNTETDILNILIPIAKDFCYLLEQAGISPPMDRKLALDFLNRC